MNWRREAAFLSAACAEVCWCTPWFVTLTPGTTSLSGASAVAWVFSLILAPMALIRLLHALHIKLRIQRWVLALTLVLAGLIALRALVYADRALTPAQVLQQPLESFTNPFNILPDELVILVAVLFLWWRGLRLGQDTPTVVLAGLRFRAGVVIFVVFMFFFVLYITRDLTPYVVAFFFCGLMAVAMARVEEVTRLRGGQAVPLGRSWLGVLALATLLVIGAGVGLTSFLLGPLPGEVLGWLSPLWIVLIAILSFVMSLLVAVVAALAAALAGLMPSMDLSFLSGLGQRLQELREGLTRAGENVSPEVMEVMGNLRGLSLLACLGVMLVGTVLTLQRLRVMQARRGEKTESTPARGKWAAGLRGLLDEGAGGLARLARRFGLGRELWLALSIRRIYAQMARLAAAQGYPRAPSETPYQYLSSLARAFPDGAKQTRRITEAYIGVHYGELPETPEDLAAIRKAWTELRASVKTAA
jgi:hypothetical protein